MQTHGAWVGGKVMPEWRVWQEMKQRCYNPKSNRYRTHGARGITVCRRWRKSFTAFLEDMGKRPEGGLSLERRDNDGNYRPDNCYWATKKQQARNKRNTKFLTVAGVTKPLTEWAEIKGLRPMTIRGRLRMGWTPEQAVNTPKKTFWTRRRPAQTF